MSKYINKNDLINRLYTIKHPTMPIINGFQFISIDDAINLVLERPDADVVERKKGKWIDGHCSECGCDVPAYIIDWKWAKDMDAKFCPNCGAEMENVE